MFRAVGQQFVASRVAYFIATGNEPGDLLVCHTCDNPPCCNPAHLFLGTQEDNMRDASAKGRFRHRPIRSGDDARTRKLCSADVEAIRVRFAAGATVAALAGEFGVSRSTVRYVIRGIFWHDAAGPTLSTLQASIAERGAGGTVARHPGSNLRPATHCKRGHAFTPENTAVYAGKRKCRACSRARREERA